MSLNKLVRLTIAIMMILIAVPYDSFAFRAPHAGSAVGGGSKGLAAPLQPRTGLELKTVHLRNIGKAISGNLTQGALSQVEELMQSAGSEAKPLGVQKDKLGHRHMRMAQYYQGLPVIGAQLIVHTNERDIVYQVNGNYLPKISVSLTPSIEPEQALLTGLDEQRGKPGMAVSRTPALVIYGSSLAYQYIISHTGQTPGQWIYYVDAHTGKLLSRYNNIKFSAPTENGTYETVRGNRLEGEDGASVSMTGWKKTGGNYYLYNSGAHWGIFDTDRRDWEQQASNNWGVNDRAAVSAGWNMALTQAYVMEEMGRESFDGSGAFACANVHEGYDYVNAYWDGEALYFGDGDGEWADPLTTLDIVAHEFGHAVTQYTSDLVYSDESGALNESFSDILGAVVEFYSQPDGRGSYPNETAGHADWLCGEDAWLEEVALRDLRNPQRYEQPSALYGTYWYSGYEDNGGVHTNSGVQNFAFYLLSEGGTGNNDGHPYDITGIGWQAAAAIAMRANTVYLTPSAQYYNARQAWIDAATDLGYDAQSVAAVWSACGVEEFVPCEETMPIELGETIEGAWETTCTSTHRLGSFAKFYTFTLFSEERVTIDLSSTEDTYLYLLSGNETSGEVLAGNDDSNGTRNSQICETLSAGTYTIEATTYSGSRLGSFSLTADVAIVPATPVTISPKRTIPTEKPAYKWNASGGATSYQLAVYSERSASYVVNESVDGSYCTEGVCSYRPNVTLSNGRYRFKVLAMTSAGSSDYSAFRAFTVRVRAPRVPTTLSPRGTIATAAPTYSWSESTGATTYQLAVFSDSSASYVVNERVSDSFCSDGVCSYQPSATLSRGSYRFTVLARNSAGTSIYSPFRRFNVSPGAFH